MIKNILKKEKLKIDNRIEKQLTKKTYIKSVSSTERQLELIKSLISHRQQQSYQSINKS